jgi:hypothetical protein
LKKKIESEKSFLGLANTERYWANEDIRKSAVLPSETVRSAYDTLSTFNGMAAESQKQIASLEWCVQCAMKRPTGEADCR